MAFFKNLFGGKSASTDPASQASSADPAQAIIFGRYTDANKSAKQLDAWARSNDLFKQQKYIDAHEAFLEYLRDDAVGNVEWKREGDRLDFALTQGSKIIQGYSTPEKVHAETDLARFDKPSVAFMRKLMTLNFSLNYSRFCLKDDRICMKFGSSMIDASPNKMYFSLKEICQKADKQDNLLIDEFSMLQPVGEEHIGAIPEAEKEVKYTYFQKWVNETLAKIATFDETKFAGAISFYLLATAYRIDYLLMPEGVLVADLERIHGIYFAKDNRPMEAKNRDIIDIFKKLQEKPKAYFFESFYRTRATFGLVAGTNRQTVADLIFNESANDTWYVQNNYPAVVKTIYEYIIGYSLFNHGLFSGYQSMFRIFMELNNPDFFAALGFESLVGADGIPVKEKVDARIAAVVAQERKNYPNFAFITANLAYTSFNDFAKSYLKELDVLDFTPAVAPTPQA
jgi:hypothetical protein